MTTVLAVSLVAAILVVGAVRRRRPSIAADVALILVAVAVACLALMDSLPIWARIGYLTIGVAAAVATVVSRARKTSGGDQSMEAHH